MENSDHQPHIYTTKVQSSVKPVSDRQESLYLPIEIISDILSRLSVPTVLRFRTVCKAWSNLTCTQVFVHQHLERFHKNIETNHGSQTLRCNIDSISYYSSEGHSRSVKMTPMSCYILQHCHGLVVCVMYIDDVFDCTMGILNPAVDDELIMLPDEGMTGGQSFDACLCYDPPSNKYKVIRIIDCIDDDDDDIILEMGVEVLTLGDDSWRQLGQVPSLSEFDRHDKINIHGAIHWITSETKILSFKIGNEDIDLIEYPASEDSSPQTDYDYLIEYEDCLCVVRRYWPPLKLKFFVMEDYANRVWKEHGIDLEQMVDPPIPKGHGMYSAVYSIIGAHNGKLILGNSKSVDMYYYDPKTRSVEKYDGTRPRRPSYKESLISARTILFGET